VGFSRQGLADLAELFKIPGANKALITAWEKPGILDERRYVPRGPRGGRGANYEWSDEQAVVFLTALQWRRNFTRLADLCTVPISLWLYMDDGFLPLRQVRKAMRTWIFRNQGTIREEETLAHARWVVKTYCPPETPPKVKRWLRDEVAEIFSTHAYDFDRTVRVFEEALPEKWGPLETPPKTFALAVMVPAIAMDRFDELTDDDFVQARLRQRATLPEYLDRHPDLASSDEYDGMFKKGDLAQLIREASQDVTTLLGMELFARDRGLSMTVEPPEIGQGILAPFAAPIAELTALIDAEEQGSDGAL
jgi:hypothetical protein